MDGDKFRIGSFLLTEEEVRKRRDYLEIGEEEEALLRAVHPHIAKHVGAIVERFYDYLLSHEHTRTMLDSPGLVERLKGIQTRYFLELTSGRYDIAYFENRLRVGMAHDRVGLEPEWYLGAYDKYLQIVTDVLRQELRDDPERFFETGVSLTKVIFLDMSLALDAYIFSAQEKRERQAADLAAANEELRRLDAAKRRLTDMIVHDLQNPLAGIVAFLQILDAREEGLTDQERRGLREALARCDDLSQLILNVLQLSRAEEGRLDLYLETVDVNEVARRAAGAFEAVAERGGRVLRLELEEAPVLLRTDQSLLKRILYNLIRNALRHTGEGTEVRVRVRSGPPVTLSVQDDGPGIPPEVQKRIFEPFAARAYGTDSGLGLSFCKMAAAQLGLTLRLETPRDGGSAFLLQPDSGGEDAGSARSR